MDFRLNRLPRPISARKVLPFIAGMIAAILLLALGYSYLFGPVEKEAPVSEFLVQPGATVEHVATSLKEQGYIKNLWAFRIAYLSSNEGRGIRPGSYELEKDMDMWSLAEKLVSPPHLAFITFTAGMRKEQMAEILTDTLGWTDEQKEKWISIDTAVTPDLIEGVYYPDTYLIPSGQDPAYVAARLRGRFQDVFAPYAAEAADKGLSWSEVLTMASLIEREAARNDKALVAGILWNRIDDGMNLGVDATLQYIRGNESNWWPVPKSEDKYLESEFNTYQNEGLPPHPIANPSLESIEAALNPDRTSCLFYIHDNRGQIHCSPTYSGHLSNINRYLK